VIDGQTMAKLLGWAARKNADRRGVDTRSVMLLRTIGRCLMCSPRSMTLEEVIADAVAIDPEAWALSSGTCVDEATNPCQCCQDDDRQHWLLDF
jgi:hypothetical protein